MANGKVPYDKLENTGDGAVYGSRISVSSTNSDSISEAIDKLEQGASNTSFKTRRDFTGIPVSGDTQYYLFGRGALPNTGLRWNENTDKIEFSNDGVTWEDLANAGGSATKVETVVVDNQIVNIDKYYDLDLLPSDPSNVRVFVSGATTEVRFPGDDYIITLDDGFVQKRLDWSGLGLAGDLVIGDKLMIVYETTETISGISSGPILLKVDALTLSGGDITNAYKDLSEIPLDYTQVALFVAGGTAQVYGSDYTVTVDGSGDLKRVYWVGTPLDGDLDPGDILIAIYNIGSGAGGAITADHVGVDSDPFTGNLAALTNPVTLQEVLEEVDQMTTVATATDVTTSTVNFDNLLTVSETNVQLALDKLNDVTATELKADTTNFNGILNATHDHVQEALDALDDHTHSADQISVIAAGYAGLLSPTDTDVQTALDTLDAVTATDIPASGFTGFLNGSSTVQYALNTVDLYLDTSSRYTNETLVVDTNTPLDFIWQPLEFRLPNNYGYLFWLNTQGEGTTNVGNSITSSHDLWNKDSRLVTRNRLTVSYSSPFDVDMGLNAFYSVSNTSGSTQSFRYSLDITLSNWELRQISYTSLKLPLDSSVSFSETASTSFTNSPNPVIPLSDSFAVSDSANKVLVLATIDNLNTSSSPSTINLRNNGSTVAVFSFADRSAPVSLAYLITPGDTAAHTYDLQFTDGTVGAITADSGKLILAEVNETLYNTAQQTGTGAVGPYAQSLTVSAGSKVMAILCAAPHIAGADVSGSVNLVEVDMTVDAAVKSTNTLTYGENADPHTGTIVYISEPLTAGSHNFTADFNITGGVTVGSVVYILVEIPA